jgi:hypothetical protein
MGYNHRLSDQEDMTHGRIDPRFKKSIENVEGQSTKGGTLQPYKSMAKYHT